VELCTLPTAAKIEDLIRRLGELEAKLEGAPGVAPERSSDPGTQALGSATPPAPTPASRRGPSTPRAEQEPSRAAVGATALRLVESPGPADVEAPDPSDPVLRWRQAVDRVKERKLLLGTCLEEGSFLGMAGGNVRIALSTEHAFHRAMLELKENREILNEELERFYGRGAKLLCESAIPAAHEAQDAGRRGPKAAPAPGGIPEGTIVERIVELFDGEVLGPGLDPGPGEGNL